MSCKKFRDEIEEAAPKLSLSAETRSHLQRCGGCDQFYAEQVSLRRLVRDLETVAAPVDFEFRLRARLATAKNRAERSGFLSRNFAPSAPSIALAACFTLTVAVTLYLSRYQFTDTAPTQPAAGWNADVMRRSPRSPEGPQRLADTAALKRPAAVKTDKVLRSVPTAKRRPLRPIRNSDAVFESASVEEARKAFDFAVGPASVVMSPAPGVAEIGGGESPVAISLLISAQPVKVLLRDERGAPRLVSVETVTFGGQDFIKRTSGNAISPLPAKEGVW